MILLTRRSFALCALAPGPLLAATLPAPASLQSELAAALRDGNPLVVMASLEGCPFCKVVRDSHLAPLRSETGQPIVQVDIKSARAVLDFNGKPATHDALLQAWGVKVLPTVLFFGKGGVEVAPRLVGASIPDFYGAYLDERLRVARAAVR
jgi:thioredoxin-related protein